jgi:hypothetical protein
VDFRKTIIKKLLSSKYYDGLPVVGWVKRILFCGAPYNCLQQGLEGVEYSNFIDRNIDEI